MIIPRLEPDEKILRKEKAVPGYSNLLFIVLILLGPFLVIPLYMLSLLLTIGFKQIDYSYLFTGVSIIYVIIVILLGSRARNQHYWITNKRIIYNNLLFSKKFESIYYEKIRYVGSRKSFLERIFKFEALIVIIHVVKNFFIETKPFIVLQGFENVEATRKIILNELNKLKKSKEIDLGIEKID
jgi:hypothetical protein